MGTDKLLPCQTTSLHQIQFVQQFSGPLFVGFIRFWENIILTKINTYYRWPYHMQRGGYIMASFWAPTGDVVGPTYLPKVDDADTVCGPLLYW